MLSKVLMSTDTTVVLRLIKQAWRQVAKVLQLQSRPCSVFFAAKLKPFGAKIKLRKGGKKQLALVCFLQNTSPTKNFSYLYFPHVD